MRAVIVVVDQRPENAGFGSRIMRDRCETPVHHGDVASNAVMDRASNRMHPRLARSLVVGRQTCHHPKIPIQSLDNDFGRFRLYIQRKRSERSHKVRSRGNKKLLLEVIGKSL